MSTFSNEMDALALELLTEFGEAVSFTRTTEGAYDSATGTTGTSSDLVFTGFGSPQDYDTKDIDGLLVEEGDVKLYVNATSTSPARGDAVTLDSKVYRVMRVRRFAINSADVLYELQIRI